MAAKTKNTDPCPPTQGHKHDKGKLRYDLIPPEAEASLAAVLTFGANKYGDRNWELGIDEDRLYAARRRHEAAHRTGEILDPESGLPHLWHALTTLAMSITLEIRKTNNNQGKHTQSRNGQ